MKNNHKYKKIYKNKSFDDFYGITPSLAIPFLYICKRNNTDNFIF
jgi:hypothetical protein